MAPTRRRSIRNTLLLFLLPAAIALMAVAWLIHGLLLERMARDFAERRLQDEATFLEHQVRLTGHDLSDLRTGDYFEEVFHHAFAIRTGSSTLISPERWHPALEPLLGEVTTGFKHLPKETLPPGTGDVLAYRTTITVDGAPATIIVAEDLGDLAHSQSELHLWTAVVSLAMIVLLAVVIWFGITLALRSVDHIQAALRGLQLGERDRIDVDSPAEFQPLVQQMNGLLDTLDLRLDRSRKALANLSHSVKTPIAAVRQILEDQHRPLDTGLRLEMARRLADLDRQLEAEMRRSQFAGPQAGKTALPVRQARDLLWMLGRLHPDTRFELATELPDSCRWPVEEHDLSEIMGNLLDNAGKWAERCVELALQEQTGQLLLSVSDDGPGVAEEVLSSLGTRGLRLDEQQPGHGLGLAIVTDIAKRYGGTVMFSNRAGRGLQVEVRIPRPSLFTDDTRKPATPSPE